MALLKHESGEWIWIGGTATDPDAHTPVDVTGASVVARVRTGPKVTDALVLIAEGAVTNAPAGEVRVGFRLDDPGYYYVSIEIDKGGADGWPVIEQTQVRIIDRP